jgi:YD repeat-containing protein
VRIRRFRLRCLRAATLSVLIAVVAIGGRSAQGGDGKVAPACRMETRLNPGGPVLFETMYFVDGKGRLSRTESSKRDDTFARSRYRRDAAGRVVEKCDFSVERGVEKLDGCARHRFQGGAARPFETDFVDRDGKVIRRHVHIYDKAGREIERRTKLTTGSATWVLTNSYASDGRLVRTQIVSSMMAGTTTHEYHYDASGARREEVIEGSYLHTYTVPCPESLLVDAS